MLTSDEVKEGVYNDKMLIDVNSKLNQDLGSNKLPLILGIVFLSLSVIGLILFIIKKKSKK